MGIKVRNLKTSESGRQDIPSQSFWKKEIHLFGPAFGSKKKEQFYTELSVLLSSGIRLKDALALVAESQKKDKDKHRYEQMVSTIVAGHDFSKVLEEDNSFGRYEEYSIRIGEHTGTLDKVCQSLADFYTRKNELKKSITTALTYPIIILSTAILAVVFMLRFVVPMFEDLFKQNDAELPALTKIVITASEVMGAYGPIILLIISLIFLSRKWYAKNVQYRKLKALVLIKTPILGPFIRLAQIARFTQAVSLLVSAKISIPESIKLAGEMIDFYPLERAIECLEEDILQGKPLSESLKAQAIFDNKMVALVRVAEETNQTVFVFQRLNEQYSKDVLQKSKQFSTLLEPIIILLVGVLIGVILIAMYLPMFELGNVL